MGTFATKTIQRKNSAESNQTIQAKNADVASAFANKRAESGVQASLQTSANNSQQVAHTNRYAQLANKNTTSAGSQILQKKSKGLIAKEANEEINQEIEQVGQYGQTTNQKSPITSTTIQRKDEASDASPDTELLKEVATVEDANQSVTEATGQIKSADEMQFDDILRAMGTVAKFGVGLAATVLTAGMTIATMSFAMIAKLLAVKAGQAGINYLVDTSTHNEKDAKSTSQEQIEHNRKNGIVGDVKDGVHDAWSNKENIAKNAAKGAAVSVVSKQVIGVDISAFLDLGQLNRSMESRFQTQIQHAANAAKSVASGMGIFKKWAAEKRKYSAEATSSRKSMFFFSQAVKLGALHHDFWYSAYIYRARINEKFKDSEKYLEAQMKNLAKFTSEKNKKRTQEIIKTITGFHGATISVMDLNIDKNAKDSGLSS